MQCSLTISLCSLFCGWVRMVRSTKGENTLENEKKNTSPPLLVYSANLASSMYRRRFECLIVTSLEEREAKTPAHVYGSSFKLSTIFLGASTWENQKAGILGIHKKQLRFQDLCSGRVKQVAIWWADINYSVFQVESWRRGRKKHKTSTESSHKSFSLGPKNHAQPSIYGTCTMLRTEHLSHFIVSIWVVFGL